MESYLDARYCIKYRIHVLYNSLNKHTRYIDNQSHPPPKYTLWLSHPPLSIESPASRRKMRVLRGAVLSRDDWQLLYDKLAMSNTYSHAKNCNDPRPITLSKMAFLESGFSAVAILGGGWLQSPASDGPPCFPRLKFPIVFWGIPIPVGQHIYHVYWDGPEETTLNMIYNRICDGFFFWYIVPLFLHSSPGQDKFNNQKKKKINIFIYVAGGSIPDWWWVMRSEMDRRVHKRMTSVDRLDNNQSVTLKNMPTHVVSPIIGWQTNQHQNSWDVFFQISVEIFDLSEDSRCLWQRFWYKRLKNKYLRLIWKYFLFGTFLYLNIYIYIVS